MSGQQTMNSGMTQWSTHDPACNHCRARKIKCGREHPQCASCKRDGAQCDFSDQGKRISHIKVLVDNFGGLEGRLVSIEKELVRLTDTLQQGKEKYRDQIYNLPSDSGFPVSRGSDGEWTGSHTPIELSEVQLVADEDKKQKRKRKLVQQPGDDYAVSDRYHEPCTLPALCNELRDLNLKTHMSSSYPTSAPASGTATPWTSVSSLRDDLMRKETANSLLTTLCSVVSTEEPLDLIEDPNVNPVILLPPKQFLVMACTPFFQQNDPAMDLFCQPTFWANVEKVYSKPFTSADDAWALCFNNIILLVLVAGQPGFGSGSVMGSQFAMPFISTMRCALAYPDLFTAPTLINVQALALLSVTAQQHSQPFVAEAVHERACRLAKKMGLHQQRVSGSRTPSEEDEERLKVFRSLFLRDKTFSISRGINCWLPSLECSISFALGKSLPTDTVMLARLQLARLQEEIYRALYSSESFPLSTNQQRAAICRIEEGLRQWAEEAYEDPKSSKAVHAIDVQLDFRASRIVALRSSSDPKHMEQIVLEARASSLLLITAVGRVANAAPSTPESLPSGLAFGSPSSLSQSESEHASLRIRSLAERFSVPAFFALVRNLIWPVLEDLDQCDLELLHAVSQIFKDLEHGTRVKTYTRIVSDTFQSLLTIVQVLRPDLFEQQEQLEHQDYQQRGFHLAQHISRQLPMVPIDLTNFSNTVPLTTWQPLNFANASAPPQLAVNIATANLSAFEYPGALEYDGRIYPYDFTQTIPLSSQGHYNNSNKQGFVSPTASNKDYHHPPLFTQFPAISTMPPVDGEQQDANHYPF